MSSEKEKLEKLLERVDELLLVLAKITEDLKSVSTSIRSIAVSKTIQPEPQIPTIGSYRIFEKNKSVKDIRVEFPEDLETLLSFQEEGDYVLVKPRQFLGSENFAKIASIVREMGGEYISEGKNSHFRVPKKTQM